MHVSVCLSVCLCACEAARAVKLPLTGCVAVRDTPSDVSLSLSVCVCVCTCSRICTQPQTSALLDADAGAVLGSQLPHRCDGGFC